ncbi:fumarate hydratase class II [Desulfobaculum xiamenense]|uniref:Fumarate hydratase class II n=1 Tax=Desulfobaculum xiamenense TaxID=995050 RepID=A0A846QL66_9BACT|nr:class II fumarate hydratase [Desulfobaculum xiamenense]NJB68861.1 fumarate hydratase class II [Desulfobaculum xiamenense]
MSGRSDDMMRVEVDSLGTVQVPRDRLWGAQTQRALENFPQGEGMPVPIVRAMCRIKGAAARVNARLGLVPQAVATLVDRAARGGVGGHLDEHFPLSIWQSGSGTQTNMNVNEVLANRAAQLAGEEPGRKTPVHPNDHVNRCQSTNDVFPAAMHMATADALASGVIPTAEALSAELAARAEAWSGIVKIGRTHLMDAVPITLGQEFSGYAAQVDAATEGLRRALTPLWELPLGGTAVGTGLNAHPEFARLVIDELARETGYPFIPARNRFALIAAHDALGGVSAAMRTLACALNKIANDIRWLASGPACGIGELRLPANEPGSSIMPGKVNPSQCEVLCMACMQVVGLDAVVAAACAQGNFELNVCKPLIAFDVLTQCRILAESTASFTARAVVGLEPDEGRIAAHVSRSLMLVTALAPVVGYDVAARVAKFAQERHVSLREACVALDVLSGEEFDAIVRPLDMVGPLPGD